MPGVWTWNFTERWGKCSSCIRKQVQQPIFYWFLILLLGQSHTRSVSHSVLLDIFSAFFLHYVFVFKITKNKAWCEKWNRDITWRVTAPTCSVSENSADTGNNIRKTVWAQGVLITESVWRWKHLYSYSIVSCDNITGHVSTMLCVIFGKVRCPFLTSFYGGILQ